MRQLLLDQHRDWSSARYRANSLVVTCVFLQIEIGLPGAYQFFLDQFS